MLKNELHLIYEIQKITGKFCFAGARDKKSLIGPNHEQTGPTTPRPRKRRSQKGRNLKKLEKILKGA